MKQKNIKFDLFESLKYFVILEFGGIFISGFLFAKQLYVLSILYFIFGLIFGIITGEAIKHDNR